MLMTRIYCRMETTTNSCLESTLTTHSTLNGSDSVADFNASASFPSPSQDGSQAPLLFPIRVAYIVVGAIGTVGNLQVSAVMFTYKPLKSRLANYYLANQCIIDLILSVVVVLLFTFDVGKVTGVAGEVVCRLWKNRSVFLGFFTASLFSVVALTIERYSEVVYPIQHKIFINRRFVVWSLVVVNIVGISLKLSYVASTTRLTDSAVCQVGVYPNRGVKRLTGLLNCLVEFFIPLAIFGFCYSGMVRALNRRIQPQSTAAARSTAATWTGARRGILRMLISVCLVFVVCTTFKQTITLMYFFDVYNVVGINDPLIQASTVLAYSNCCLNPFVYFFKYTEFQRGLKWFYGRRKKNTSGRTFHETESNTVTDRF